MTLFQSYLLAGSIFLFPALVPLALGARALPFAIAFSRSGLAAVLCFGGGALWFLAGIHMLGESDLAGFSRSLLMGVFGAAALLSFRFLRDFLAVRGLGILLLLLARAFLDAGFMQHPYNLALSVVSYFFVLLGICWGVMPYRFRDWAGILLATSARARATGMVLVFAALGCFACAGWVALSGPPA
ncbi:MAG: hypothetical protein LBG65_08315 [Puniceicoccales bacterium]|jgi:hypothetical protein|nr:hypothetical protein [Puniceicoccales bacterium]